MLRIVLIYGSVLAMGSLTLEWLQYQYVLRAHPAEGWLALIALTTGAGGIWVGARLFPRGPAPTALNVRAQAALGISERELQVLQLLAAGQSNKQIAQGLQVSPNTVKTHLANLYGKLDVRRRTEAILRARELGMIR